MSKPNPTAIARAGRLTSEPTRPADPITACNLCGGPSTSLRAYRECGQYDEPLDGPAALLFVGRDHRLCQKRVTDHPRLYDDDRGAPGTFPLLCGPCVHRDGFGCRHPDLKANGGEGLNVSLSNGLPPGTIVCGRGGRITPIHQATACKGRDARAHGRELPQEGTSER